MSHVKTRFMHHPYYRFILFLCSLELIVISVNFFYAPINIAAGGATGMAILLDAAFGINRAFSVLAINIFMIILAFIFLDKKVVKNVTLGSLLLPVLLYITPSFKLVSDPLLAVTIGGGIFAIGIALLYRLNASSGGTTVPPMILKKYFHINPASSLLVIDMIVTAFNILVSGLDAFFMAAFSLIITSLVMNHTEAGLDHKYQVQIMSNAKITEIKEMLLASEHSLTITDVRGGFSANNKEMLMAIVDNSDYGPLIDAIHEVDPDAFIVTSNVVKAHGGSFEL